MMSRGKISLVFAFCSSVGAHGMTYASLSTPPRKPFRPSAPSEMNFELPPLPTAAAEPQLQPPSPARDPAPSRTVPATRTLAPSAKLTAATPARPAPEPQPARPALDLSGVTLTNDTGTGFAVPTGDGSALHGPIGLGANRDRPVAASPSAPGAHQPPALVDASDLSEHPKPPFALASLLRENYPEEARQRGLRGSASLRARIAADGVIRAARLLSESSAGFGAACQRTVLGSRWSAPRDKNGRAVATEIVYTCHFEVDQ